MSAQDDAPQGLLMKFAYSRTAARLRRRRARIDNVEVRRARALARLVRAGAFDVLMLGDSMVGFTAPYDSDKRPFHQMVQDSLGLDSPMHVVPGGGYNPPLFNGFVRQLEAHPGRPLVILPLTVRIHTFPWLRHPFYSYERPSRFLSTVDATTPLRRIRKGFPLPGSREFAKFYALTFPTWAGDLTIGDYVHPLKGNDLGEVEAARLLYAYHHGGEVDQGAPLEPLRELGERLSRLGLPVVVYQTPVPVEKGVELHGPQFRELAERNFAALEEAFVSGYGDVSVLRTGLSTPTAHFIDWHDGSEHLNEHGRLPIAAAVVDAAKALRS